MKFVAAAVVLAASLADAPWGQPSTACLSRNQVFAMPFMRGKPLADYMSPAGVHIEHYAGLRFYAAYRTDATSTRRVAVHDDSDSSLCYRLTNDLLPR